MRASVWGQEISHVGHIHAAVMGCSVPLLFPIVAFLRFCHSDSEAVGAARRRGRVERGGGLVAHTPSLQLRVSVPFAEVPAEPAQDRRHCLGVLAGPGGECGHKLAVHLCVGFWSCGCGYCFGHLVVGVGVWVVWLYGLWWVPFDLDWSFHGSLFWTLGLSQTLCCFWGHAVVSSSLSYSFLRVFFLCCWYPLFKLWEILLSQFQQMHHLRLFSFSMSVILGN